MSAAIAVGHGAGSAVAPMQLRHIELLQAILQSGSLTAAAELLCISQPAASKALKHAEQQLGFALFTRVRGKLQPTEEALILSRETERLARGLESIRRLSDNLRHGEARPIRLVGTPALVQTLIPEAVCRWREVFPNAICELASHHTQEIVQALLLREADIGLTLQPVRHPDLRVEVVGEGRMMVIAPPDWWAAEALASPLPLQALSGTPFVALESDDMLVHTLHSQLSQLVPPPRINVWVQTYQLARRLVAAGQGLALVDPLTALDGQAERLQARPLEPRVSVRLHVLCRIDKAHGPAERRLLALVDGVARRLLRGPGGVGG